MRVGVGLILAHGFGGQVGPAKLGDDALDFGEALDSAFDLVADRDGLGERDAGQALGGDHQRAFVEPGHELRADEFERAKAEDDEDSGGDEDSP